MRLARVGEAGPDLGHLTYCTNIHPGESWRAMADALSAHLPAIKLAVSPGAPFGLGLRIAADAAETLKAPGARAELADLLAETGTYLFTINGFPFGSFHGTRVKENVYAPDWSTPERLAYTDGLADLLAGFLPEEVGMGSISTVPVTFRGWADEARLEAAVENLIGHAALLVDIERERGRHIALALEPEPCCYLETIEETVRFFEDRLFVRSACRRLADRAGMSMAGTEAALRRHLGVCYDVCHAAVEFEDPAGSLALLEGADITIPKLQLSSALRIAAMDGAAAAALKPFEEPVYLHQVVEQAPDRLTRYLDLPEALAEVRAATGREWRVHFHVPVFLAELEAFSTTQDFLRQVIARHRERPVSPHLEVETYTWDVLPRDYRTVEVDEAIARELNWVLGELGV